MFEHDHHHHPDRNEIHIQYNSPVILTFFFVSFAVLVLGYITGGMTDGLLFSVYRSSLLSPLTYVRFFGHVLGHANYAHFISNMTLLLVIGPPMEEHYGSKTLLELMLITALLSGLVQFLFFPGTALLGASGIVFMLIILSSLSGSSRNQIPLTLILVSVIYIGGEVADAIFAVDNVSHLTHIIGGACGGVFGYTLRRNGCGRHHHHH